MSSVEKACEESPEASRATYLARTPVTRALQSTPNHPFALKLQFSSGDEAGDECFTQIPDFKIPLQKPLTDNVLLVFVFLEVTGSTRRLQSIKDRSAATRPSPTPSPVDAGLVTAPPAPRCNVLLQEGVGRAWERLTGVRLVVLVIWRNRKSCFMAE